MDEIELFCNKDEGWVCASAHESLWPWTGIIAAEGDLRLVATLGHRQQNNYFTTCLLKDGSISLKDRLHSATQSCPLGFPQKSLWALCALPFVKPLRYGLLLNTRIWVPYAIPWTAFQSGCVYALRTVYKALHSKDNKDKVHLVEYKSCEDLKNKSFEIFYHAYSIIPYDHM